MPKCPKCREENVEGTPLCRACGETLPQSSAREPAADAVADVNSEDADLFELIRAGKKIDAIKLYGERNGVGLAEAKAAVETLAAGGTPDVSASPAENNDVLELMRGGKKIQAIKVYRERYHVGLKEAKDAVEALAAEHRIAAQGSGCAGMALLGMVGLAAGAWRLLG